MKTITEFLASTLKNALKTRQELTAAGKTAEELPAAMGEALKLEGDKLTLLLSTLEVIEKKTNDLKRVVVLTLQEGETAPRGTEQKGEHYFSVEFFPPMPGQERKGRGRDSKGRDGQGRGDKRGGKRGGGRDAKGRGPHRGEHAGAAGPGTGAPQQVGEAGAPSDENRRRRRPRGPRREGAGGPPGYVPKQAQPAGPSVPLKPIQPKTPIQPKPQQPAAEAPSDSTPPTSA